MKRKVNRVGTNTLTVSLPSKWCKENNIKVGNELDVTDEGNSLRIGYKSARKKQKIVITVDSVANFLMRNISRPYRQGYDEIKVIFKDPQILDKVQRSVEMMHGFEIIEQDENYCVIQSIALGSNEKIDDFVRRLFHITNTMIGDYHEALNSKQFDRLPNIANLERMNSRLADFCKRILNMYGYHKPQKANGLYTIVGMLEEIADDLRDMCSLKHTTPAFTNLIKLLVEHSNHLYKIFYGDVESLPDFKKRRQNIIKKIDLMYIKANPEEIKALAHLQAIILRMHHVTEEI